MILVAAAETAFAALLKPIMDGGFIERDAAMIKWAPGVLVIIFWCVRLGLFLTSTVYPGYPAMWFMT